MMQMRFEKAESIAEGEVHMQKTNKKNKIRWDNWERSLKIVAAVVSLLFAALMLYPYDLCGFKRDEG